MGKFILRKAATPIPPGAHWMTISRAKHPSSPLAGRHLLLDDQGKILAGRIPPEFIGKMLNDVHMHGNEMVHEPFRDVVKAAQNRADAKFTLTPHQEDIMVTAFHQHPTQGVRERMWDVVDALEKDGMPFKKARHVASCTVYQMVDSKHIKASDMNGWTKVRGGGSAANASQQNRQQQAQASTLQLQLPVSKKTPKSDIRMPEYFSNPDKVRERLMKIFTKNDFIDLSSPEVAYKKIIKDKSMYNPRNKFSIIAYLEDMKVLPEGFAKAVMLEDLQMWKTSNPYAEINRNSANQLMEKMQQVCGNSFTEEYRKHPWDVMIQMVKDVDFYDINGGSFDPAKRLILYNCLNSSKNVYVNTNGNHQVIPLKNPYNTISSVTDWPLTSNMLSPLVGSDEVTIMNYRVLAQMAPGQIDLFDPSVEKGNLSKVFLIQSFKHFFPELEISVIAKGLMEPGSVAKKWQPLFKDFYNYLFGPLRSGPMIQKPLAINNLKNDIKSAEKYLKNREYFYANATANGMPALKLWEKLIDQRDATIPISSNPIGGPRVLNLADSDEQQAIFDLVNNSRSNVHKFNIIPRQVFKIEYDCEEFDKKAQEIGNVKQLFHGTHNDKVANIIVSGLKAPGMDGIKLATGNMFGKGVYFADVSSKSAQYSDWGDNAILFIADVALGKELSATGAMPNATSATLQTKGVKFEPDNPDELKRAIINMEGLRRLYRVFDALKASGKPQEFKMLQDLIQNAIGRYTRSDFNKVFEVIQPYINQIGYRAIFNVSKLRPMRNSDPTMLMDTFNLVGKKLTQEINDSDEDLSDLLIGGDEAYSYRFDHVFNSISFYLFKEDSLKRVLKHVGGLQTTHAIKASQYTETYNSLHGVPEAGGLFNHEWIVFDPAQIKLRYAVVFDKT